MLYKPPAAIQPNADRCQDEDRYFQPMTLKHIDHFFGALASMDALTALWPARNTIGRGQ
jgi:hypothetical protein